MMTWLQRPYCTRAAICSMVSTSQPRPPGCSINGKSRFRISACACPIWWRVYCVPSCGEMTARGEKWNQIYRWLEQVLNRIDGVEVPHRQKREAFVASSIQFHVNGFDKAQLQTLADRCTQRGVAIKWFGRAEPVGYTSQYHHWQYLQPQALPDTSEILATTCDMRIPLSLSRTQCGAVARIIEQEISNLKNP